MDKQVSKPSPKQPPPPFCTLSLSPCYDSGFNTFTIQQETGMIGLKVPEKYGCHQVIQDVTKTAKGSQSGKIAIIISPEAVLALRELGLILIIFAPAFTQSN